MKLLTICPTRNRLEMFKEMYASFKATSSSDIIVSLDDDDPQFEEYKDFLLEEKIPFLESMPKTLTQHFNDCFCALNTYDFYHMTNDDVIYRTKDWDKLAMTTATRYATGTIIYGNDLLQGANLPTFPIISRDIVNVLGWIQEPELNLLCGDMVWKEIGQSAKCLHYMPEIIIEHRHFINGKRLNDRTEYEKEHGLDLMRFANWLANRSISDIRKVRKVLNGYKSDSIVS